MKVANVMAGAPAGGAELFFERFSLALHGAGDLVLPVIRRDEARAGRLLGGGLTAAQFRFGGALDLLTRPRLGRRLRDFAPSVVIAWMNRAARLTPRGKWTLVGRLGGYYDLRYYRSCDHLVGNTLGLVAWIRAQGWPAEKCHYLPNFVPDLGGRAAMEHAVLGVPDTAPLLVALGRLHRNKAFDVLIRAVGRLRGVHLVIAGEGPERAALMALAQREGVASRVHMPGWLQDTGALLAASDLLVCSSRHETLGNVVIEAWSAGRPVVASGQGPGELIRSGRDGVLVAPDDDAALAAAIGGVLADREYAARLAVAGRGRFEGEFAEAPVMARWRSFLAEVEQH